jgi:hypothetical protein
MEVYHWGDVVVFQYTPEKGGDTQAAKLASFVGTLLVDAESRYNRTAENPNIIEVNCLAHPRRKLRDAEVAQPVLAAEGGAFVSAMFEVEEDAKALGLTGDALLERRQTVTKPITEAFQAWMDAVEPTLVEDELCIACGLSCHVTLASAKQAQSVVRGMGKKRIAEALLDPTLGKICATRVEGHYTWWLPAQLDPTSRFTVVLSSE